MKTLIALTALMMTAGFASAQPMPGCLTCPMAAAAPALEPQTAPMPSAGLGALTDMPGAADMPELSNEQLDRMDVLRQSHIREMLPLRTDVQIKEMELDALWRAEKLDGRKIAAKVNELSALRGRLELARVNHLLAMYEAMTPDQRKSFRPGARRGQRRGMMRGMRQGGPGPMMGGGMGPCQGPCAGDCGSD